MEECASAGVVLAVLGEALVDVGEAGADAVLVALQGVEVDGVGEVRGEQLIGFGFQARPVRGQVLDLLILARVALVERRINIGGEALVSAVVDRNPGVGVRDEAFGDRDGHGAPGAVGFLRGGAGADEVQERLMNRYIVGAVAGEPVELMHDAERDAGRGDERQHLLESATIRRACGLSRVDELAHDPRTQLVGLPRVGFALCGDREPFLGAAAFGLLPSGDAQVGHGQQHRLVLRALVSWREGGSDVGGSSGAPSLVQQFGFSFVFYSAPPL